MNANLLPDMSPVIAYYGDDLTGSTAVMEVTAFAGLETVLFLDTPDQQRLAQFPHARVIGIAGDARSRTPEWMYEHLPHYYSALKATGAPIIHYKVCSTFDSAPHIGSIGVAAEISRNYFNKPIPMLIGDLGMGRYQCFGHLFATAHDKTYRIDRHPVMSCHPVTPMDEADVLVHLQKQTKLKIALVDYISLNQGCAERMIEDHINSGVQILSFDMLDKLSAIEAGRLIWTQAQSQIFCLGSQGLERALVSYWQDEKLIEPIEYPLPPQRCTQIMVVSGSVSSITAAQIDHARRNGFATFALDLTKIDNENDWHQICENIYNKGLTALKQGQDVLIYSAEGPEDHTVAHIKNLVKDDYILSETLNKKIGNTLGSLSDSLMREHQISRLVISGGDTSGRVARHLGIDALTVLAPMAPGAPLCRAHCPSSPHNGLELVLKGGQVGTIDVFTRVKTGFEIL